MEAIVSILHRWEAWACKQLHIAKRGVEVEVACCWSKCLSCRVAKRNLDVVRSTVDIVADVEEECVVAAPMGSDLDIIHIDVCALVSVLEPEVCWLLCPENHRSLERERSLRVVGGMPIYAVDGIWGLRQVSSISPCREGLVGLLVHGLLDIYAVLCDRLACVVLIGGIGLYDRVLYDGDWHLVDLEVACLPKSIVD